MSWTDRFQERGSALCVGLDPVAARLPAGETIGSFCEKVVARTAEHAACFKPNIAFFEVMGAAGLEELARVFAACRKEGVPVLLDAKRGDIGSTAQLYAEAYLADTDLGADALTVNASLGLDTLEPLLAMARAHDRGLFVLLRTSNPGAPTFQDGMEPMLLPFLREEKSAGAVVGATDPKAGARLRKALPDTLFLVPGFGAQGGTELTPFFDEQGRGALVNSSRGILYAGEGRDDWQDAVADAASKAKQTIERARTR